MISAFFEAVRSFGECSTCCLLRAVCVTSSLSTAVCVFVQSTYSRVDNFSMWLIFKITLSSFFRHFPQGIPVLINVLLQLPATAAV